MSRWSKQSLRKEQQKKNDIENESLTFPQNTTLGHKMCRSNKHQHALPNYSLQLADIKLDAGSFYRKSKSKFYRHGWYD